MISPKVQRLSWDAFLAGMSRSSEIETTPRRKTVDENHRSPEPSAEDASPAKIVPLIPGNHRGEGGSDFEARIKKQKWIP
jgi:hypothetical protein